MRTLSLALLVALAQAADPLFPILPEAFNTTELFWQPASAGAPMAKVCCARSGSFWSSSLNASTVLRCARWAVRFIYCACAGAWRVGGVSRWCVYSMGVRGLLSKP